MVGASGKIPVVATKFLHITSPAVLTYIYFMLSFASVV
jgi:hypothetical protein